MSKSPQDEPWEIYMLIGAVLTIALVIMALVTRG